MDLRRKNKVNPNFNMSSMTDIVFLLLIFFMLTSTLVSPNALNLLLPNSKSTTVEKTNIEVAIDKDIQYYINTKKVDTLILEQSIKNIVAKNNDSDGSIILKAERSVDLKYVVKVMDIAYRNKYTIVLATKQP